MFHTGNDEKSFKPPNNVTLQAQAIIAETSSQNTIPLWAETESLRMSNVETEDLAA